jgi:O-antigen/teichoic acid export membrane protein
LGVASRARFVQALQADTEGREPVEQVFKLKRDGLHVGRGLVVLAVFVVPLVVLAALDRDIYWLSVSFGALFVGLSDTGGEFAQRFRRMGLVGLVGAALTFVGFAIGDGAWGWVVLAAFVVTLLPGWR